MTQSRVRRSRRFARLLTVALSGVILLQLAYLGRGLLEGWICGKLESVLSEATGTSVEVGGLGGNWLNYLVVEDVNLTGSGDALVQDIDGLRLQVWFSPFALLSGDLSGLRSCRITARSAAIRADGTLVDQGPGTSGEPFPVRDLAGLFPSGASVEIPEFAYGTRDSRRVGALRVGLKPGTDRRSLRVDHGGLRAEVSTHPYQTDGLGFGLDLSAAEPGEILGSFGVENEVRGGMVRLSAHCLLEPLQLGGTLLLSNVQYGGRQASASRLSWSLDSGFLQVREGSLELAGLSLRTDGLLAPSPLAPTGMPLESLRGNLTVDVSDVGPYVDLLPELRDWLNVQGRMQAWVDSGRLHVVEAWLETDDARLRVGPGEVELADRGSGRLNFDLVVSSPRTVEIPGVGELRTTGSIRGVLAGNLSEPRLNGQLELGPTAVGDLRAERLSAGVTFAQDRISFAGIDALEFGTEDQGVASHIAGEAVIDLSGSDHTDVTFSLDGQAAEGWLEFLNIEGLPEITAPSFALTGQASLGEELPSGNVELSLGGLAVAPHPPADLSGSVSVSGEGILEVERLEVRGPTHLDLAGSVPLRGGTMRFLASAPEQDLAWPTSFLPGGELEGTFQLELQAEGDVDELVAELNLAADVQSDNGRLASIWPEESLGPPPDGSGRVLVEVTQTTAGIEVERFSVESSSASLTGSGSIPVHWQPDRGLILEPTDRYLDLALRVETPGPESLGLPLTFASQLRVGTTELRIDDLDLAAGSGRVSGNISLATGWADLLEPRGPSPALVGVLELDEFSLEALPAEALGLSVLAGTLTGRAVLAGTVDAPEPNIELTLADSTIKAGSLPRLEKLNAHISLRPDGIRVEGLSGTMGGGKLRGEIAVQAANGFLWEPDASTTITGRVSGRDLLLVNEQNLRIRGHMDVDLTGSAEELLVGGTVQITNGRYARRLTLLPDFSVRGGEAGALTGGMSLLPIDSPLGQRVRIDLGVKTVRDFHVRTNILDTDLICDVRLRGQASLAHLEGTISSSAGLLRLPGTALKLDSLLATFPSERLQPELIAQASGRRHGVQIQMNVHGPISSPEIQISSIPVFSPQELWTLVTAGALPETLRSQGLEGQAALVGSYLAEELAAWYVGGESMEETTSFFERFTFVSGQDISDSGRENLLVEFSLTDKVSLQGELDVYENYNGGIVLRFRF